MGSIGAHDVGSGDAQDGGNVCTECDVDVFGGTLSSLCSINAGFRRSIETLSVFPVR